MLQYDVNISLYLNLYLFTYDHNDIRSYSSCIINWPINVRNETNIRSLESLIHFDGRKTHRQIVE